MVKEKKKSEASTYVDDIYIIMHNFSALNNHHIVLHFQSFQYVVIDC